MQIARRIGVSYAHGPTKQYEPDKLKLWKNIRPYLSWLIRFFRISLIEARSERQASYLGILWGPLSTLIFTAMLAMVFKNDNHTTTKDFFLYVLTGYVMWIFIASTITSSTTAIQRRYEFAIHNNLSLVGLFLKLLIDRFFAMGLNMVLITCAVLFLSPASIGANVFLIPPLFVMLAFVSLAVAYLVNISVIFFPDMDAIFTVGIRFMFFVSPIFWGAEGEATGVRAVLIDYNPAAYYLSVFRQSVGIVSFEPMAWIVAILTSFALCVAGIAAYARSQSFVRNLK